MMGIDPLNLISAIVALAMLGAIMALTARVRRQAKLINELTGRVEYLASNLNALCSGAVGVDQRVSKLEKKGRDLEHRQESIETKKQSDRPYGEAIQMVHQGATVNRLIDELDLSRSEAELLYSLHGTKEAV
ncbi:MAG: DUF2802 domain-containing protein [Sedimenticola sp.]